MVLRASETSDLENSGGAGGGAGGGEVAQEVAGDRPPEPQAAWTARASARTAGGPTTGSELLNVFNRRARLGVGGRALAMTFDDFCGALRWIGDVRHPRVRPPLPGYDSSAVVGGPGGALLFATPSVVRTLHFLGTEVLVKAPFQGVTDAVNGCVAQQSTLLNHVLAPPPPYPWGLHTIWLHSPASYWYAAQGCSQRPCVPSLRVHVWIGLRRSPPGLFDPCLRTLLCSFKCYGAKQRPGFAPSAWPSCKQT